MIAYVLEWLKDLWSFEPKPKPKRRRRRNGKSKVTKKSR